MLVGYSPEWVEEVFSEGCMLRMLRTSAAPEHLRKAISECLIGGGGVVRELLDLLGRKAAVTLTAGLGVLVQSISLPFWEAPVEHDFPCRLRNKRAGPSLFPIRLSACK